MSGPKVSVVVPCFNHGEFLPEAVASVLDAKRDDVELIVVDDGSTDECTRREMNTLCEQGIHVIRQENKGLAAARNAGIASSRAPYILPLDADNRVRRGYFEHAIRILDASPGVGVVYGDAEYIGIRTGRWTVGPFDRSRLLECNYIDACAVYRREVCEQNGGYDGTMPTQGAEDWDFWLSAIEHGWEFAYVPEILFEYRIGQESMLARLRASGLEAQLEEFLASKHGLLYRRAWLSLIDESRRPAASASSGRLRSPIVSRASLEPLSGGPEVAHEIRSPDENAAGLLVSAPDPLRYDVERPVDADEVPGIMVTMIPRGSRVLDVGCGTGSLARVLAKECSAEVVGVEPDPARAERAASWGMEVHAGYLTEELLQRIGSFDIVVFADVLEHLPNPHAILLLSRRALAPGGAVVASVPNVAHWAVRSELAQGRFRYQAAGIMDATHLRWFTAASVKSLFGSASFKVVQYRATAGLDAFENVCRAPLGWLSSGQRERFLRLASRRWPTLFGTQHVVKAELL